MAITRGSAIAKDQQQQPATLPPACDAAAEITSNSNSNPNNIQQQQSNVGETFSGYEQTRELRIKENRERLQKLGIVDLSLQLKSAVAATKRTPRARIERKTPLKSPSLGSPENIRRSSRLQNAPPVTYTEPKEEKSRRSRDIVLEEGAKPEFYTEEHEKLLGNTEMPWTLFVDGYRADGTRIYDPVNGKTCHQCRQKTLGQRTHCSKCELVQGQFCGDCLIMRYGEHVVEANQNPDWICPPCRGICNCSLCRHAKGWAPTGSLYKRISRLGYKSVAHYLISTKRAPPEAEKSSDAPQPAKRSLPFEVMELPDDGGTEDKAVVEKTNVNPQSEDEATTVGESDPKSEGGGRSRKRAKKDGVPTSNTNDPNASTVDQSNTKRVVRRSGRKSNNENVDVSGESVKVSGTPGDEAASIMKGPSSSDSKADSIVRRLRPRKNN